MHLYLLIYEIVCIIRIRFIIYKWLDGKKNAHFQKSVDIYYLRYFTYKSDWIIKIDDKGIKI